MVWRRKTRGEDEEKLIKISPLLTAIKLTNPQEQIHSSTSALICHFLEFSSRNAKHEDLMHYDPIGSTDGFVGREELNGSLYLTQSCIRIHNFMCLLRFAATLLLLVSSLAQFHMLAPHWLFKAVAGYIKCKSPYLRPDITFHISYIKTCKICVIWIQKSTNDYLLNTYYNIVGQSD